jgi:hypothetical protein
VYRGKGVQNSWLSFQVYIFYTRPLSLCPREDIHVKTDLCNTLFSTPWWFKAQYWRNPSILGE